MDYPARGYGEVDGKSAITLGGKELGKLFKKFTGTTLQRIIILVTAALNLR